MQKRHEPIVHGVEGGASYGSVCTCLPRRQGNLKASLLNPFYCDQNAMMAPVLSTMCRKDSLGAQTLLEAQCQDFELGSSSQAMASLPKRSSGFHATATISRNLPGLRYSMHLVVVVVVALALISFMPSVLYYLHHQPG